MGIYYCAFRYLFVQIIIFVQDLCRGVQHLCRSLGLCADLLKEKDRWLLKEYDNSQRIDIRENFFVNSSIPLLFYYSHDDPWTAGQPDKLGPNAKKIINPIGCHSPKINDPDYCPANIKQEVMDFITTYIY